MTTERGKLINWSLFIALCIIWGSSFILMKEGMKALTPYQVASIRMIFAGVVLLPIAIPQYRKIPRNKLGYVFLSGILGSFFPSFLFCLAETRIDSSLAGFLNALTPIFTIITGVLFFKTTILRNKVAGILVGFTGMLILFLAKGTAETGNGYYSLFVLGSVLSYAININMVNKFLKDIGSTHIAAVSLIPLIIPSLVILFVTGYFNQPLSNTNILMATGASGILGMFGTAVATILFYVLLKRAGPLFSTTVTYGIPFVALGWGLLAGERITLLQVCGLGVILTGVYIANRK